MNPFIVSAALFASLGANAAGLPCSIHPKKGAADSELPALAKVSRSEAESTIEVREDGFADARER